MLSGRYWAVRVEPAVWKKLWGQVTHADLDRLVAVPGDFASPPREFLARP